MQETDIYLRFLRPLNDLGLPHMVSGSVASLFYGEYRQTNDIDIILFLTQDNISKIAKAFPLDDFYFPPEEVIAMELARSQRGHFNIIDHETGFKADIYLVGRDPLHTWGLSRVRAFEIDGELIRLAPPEYVIIRKLEFFREGGSQKHLRDIHRMNASLGDQLDRKTLDELLSERGLLGDWEKALQGED